VLKTTRRAALAGMAAIATGTAAGTAVRATASPAECLHVPDLLFEAPDPLGGPKGDLLLQIIRFAGESLRADFERLVSHNPALARDVGVIQEWLQDSFSLWLERLRTAPEPVRVHYELIAQNFMGAALGTPEYQRWKESSQ
jgi:hypothetical protein